MTFKVDATTGLVEAPGLKANSITGDMIASQTIKANNIMIGDFNNLATIDEINNITISSYGQTMVSAGYNKLVTDSGAFLMFTEQRGPVPYKVGDVLYYEFTAKASSATTIQFGQWTYDLMTSWLGEDPDGVWAIDRSKLSEATQDYISAWPWVVE